MHVFTRAIQRNGIGGEKWVMGQQDSHTAATHSEETKGIRTQMIFFFLNNQEALAKPAAALEYF